MGMKEYKFTYSFMLLQKEVHTLVIENCKHPSNIDYLVKELKGPITHLTKKMTTIVLMILLLIKKSLLRL